MGTKEKRKEQKGFHQKREKPKFLSPPAAKRLNRRTPEEKKDPKTKRNEQTERGIEIEKEGEREWDFLWIWIWDCRN